MPRYASPQRDLLRRCTKPYGPFAILSLPDHQWAVIRDRWLQDPAICHVLVHLPPDECEPWLLKSKKASNPVMPTLACALLRVVTLLEEEVEIVPRQASDLHDAWRIALNDLEHLLDYPEHSDSPLIAKLKEQVGEVIQFPVPASNEPAPEPG